MRRPLVAGLAACLLLGAAVAPATAKKKPRKPSVTFEASGTLALGHPGDVANGNNVTRQLFLESCSIPPTQGTDGFVIELTDDFLTRPGNVTITATEVGVPHDVDISFFDEKCASKGALATDSTDEFGLMPIGTKYVLVTAFMGTQMDFTFKAIGV